MIHSASATAVPHELLSASTPLVSIIMPCWNAAPFVSDAIESMLAQTYGNVEVIVVDDGSTDNSLDVIKSFGERIHWESGANRGGCAARNRGIDLAHGEFIQFLDADDVLFPSKLTVQMPAAIRDTLAITYCDHVRTTEDNRSLPEVQSIPPPHDDPFIFVLLHKLLSVSGPIYRREWLRRIGGFRNGLRASQDFDLNLRLAAELSRAGGHFVHVQQPLFEVRKRRGSISSDSAKTLAAQIEFLPEIITELTALNEFGACRKAETAAYAARVGRMALRGGHRAAGLALIRLGEEVDSKAAGRAWSPQMRYLKRLLGASVVERVSSLRRSFTAST
jgi:glycosyltransferase involved in cell wall biosynthesis